MKILVATGLLQGVRDDDFNHCLEGELLLLGDPAGHDYGDGCRRALPGMTSHRATTTFQVIDRSDLDVEAYRDLYRNALEAFGYVCESLDRATVVRQTKELLHVADQFAAGTILERDGLTVRLRGYVRVQPAA